MRKWKRFLGLGKLSAMAAIVLTSCSEWATDEMINATYPHTGVVYPNGAGWTWSPHADKRGENDVRTLSDYVIEIPIIDICSDVPGQECQSAFDAIMNDSNFYRDYPMRLYKVQLDARTADSVLLKKFMPDYRANMSLGEWNEITDDAHKKYMFRVDFNRKRATHEHADDHRTYRIQPVDIIRVHRDMAR